MKKTILFYFICVFISLAITLNGLKACTPGVKHDNRRAGHSFNAIPYDTTYINPHQKNFDVVHYDIHVRLDIAAKIVFGDVRISGIKRQADNAIYLNLYPNMEIDSLWLNGVTTTCIREDRVFSIHNEYPAGPDTITIRVKYHGTPRRLGFSSFVFGEINHIPMVYSMNEPQYAATWLPCNDDVADKAMMDMYITADSSMVSVSNGRLISIENNDSVKTYHWHSNYPIATYLICLYSSQYVMFEEEHKMPDGTILPLQFYVLPRHLDNAKIDFSRHARMFAVLEKLFGPYPFMKDKYGIAEFLWQGGAMEHQTITGIGTSLVKGKQYFEDMYLHELSHHWWGNSVSPKTWKDVWLNEGFASYCEALYEEQVNGQDALHSKMMEYSGFPDENPLYNPGDDMFSQKVYHKGAWVLHMLRNELGDSVFFNVLRTYYHTYQFANASTDDFINICQSVSGKDLTIFFRQWVFEDFRVPQIEYRWKFINSDILQLDIKQIQQKGVYTFPLEFDIVNGKTRSTRKIQLTKAEERFNLTVSAKPDSVILDPHQKLLIQFIEGN
ncbi:MAG: M1 family metallopeptidase [Ignavibacteria bacterium]|nr:M1 family metallopeptidase [Ignavibacteria bacterium]